MGLHKGARGAKAVRIEISYHARCDTNTSFRLENEHDTRVRKKIEATAGLDAELDSRITQEKTGKGVGMFGQCIYVVSQNEGYLLTY